MISLSRARARVSLLTLLSSSGHGVPAANCNNPPFTVADQSSDSRPGSDVPASNNPSVASATTGNGASVWQPPPAPDPRTAIDIPVWQQPAGQPAQPQPPQWVPHTHAQHMQQATLQWELRRLQDEVDTLLRLNHQNEVNTERLNQKNRIYRDAAAFFAPSSTPLLLQQWENRRLQDELDTVRLNHMHQNELNTYRLNQQNRMYRDAAAFQAPLYYRQ